MIYFLQFIDWVLSILEFLVFVVVIMSWLIAFNVVNVYNPVVRSIWDGLNGVLDPMMRPIRRFMPTIGSLDISPVIFIIIIEFFRKVVIPNIAAALV